MSQQDVVSNLVDQIESAQSTLAQFEALVPWLEELATCTKLDLTYFGGGPYSTSLQFRLTDLKSFREVAPVLEFLDARYGLRLDTWAGEPKDDGRRVNYSAMLTNPNTYHSTSIAIIATLAPDVHCVLVPTGRTRTVYEFITREVPDYIVSCPEDALRAPELNLGV